MINLPNHTTKTDAFVARMKAERIPQLFIENFKDYYRLLLSGETGLIPERTLKGVDELPDAEQFTARHFEVGETVLSKTAVIKLNGGLGTSMGLEKAKSLLPVKKGDTFLDIVARQVETYNIPLILMNSFSTDSDSLKKLKSYPHLKKSKLPLRFLQHKEPKVRQDNLQPVIYKADSTLEWCPPGHGDIYTALITSGVLNRLLSEGFKYAFVSNIDNLGAAIDLAILGYFADMRVPFMMEVADRTPMDKKGGHLARQLDGRLILRESAQCPAEDLNSFQDITHHKYFNTNNLWLHLPSLKKVMEERDFKLGLPMIRNLKPVNPRDKNSTPVYQIETAMGSAIGVFKQAQAVRVPRNRFAPVKTTNDLLAVQSDAYELTADYRIVQAKEKSSLNISLDTDNYKLMSDYNGRFPQGAPSLINCQSLVIKGDFQFGQNIVCSGEVELINETGRQVQIPDGSVLEGQLVFGG